jgi:hypothetical protein
MHDLIREHARALAGRLDPDDDRDQATARLLDYYQHTAALADTFIARQTCPGPSPADGTIPAADPALAGREQALAWAQAERADLLACLDHVTRTGQQARVTALHGPYPTWTRKVSGRTVTRTLTAEDAERLRPYFDAHRRLPQLITELETISIQLAGQPRPHTQPGDQPVSAGSAPQKPTKTNGQGVLSVTP